MKHAMRNAARRPGLLGGSTLVSRKLVFFGALFGAIPLLAACGGGGLDDEPERLGTAWQGEGGNGGSQSNGLFDSDLIATASDTGTLGTYGVYVGPGPGYVLIPFLLPLCKSGTVSGGGCTLEDHWANYANASSSNSKLVAAMVNCAFDTDFTVTHSANPSFAATGHGSNTGRGGGLIPSWNGTSAPYHINQWTDDWYLMSACVAAHINANAGSNVSICVVGPDQTTPCPSSFDLGGGKHFQEAVFAGDLFSFGGKSLYAADGVDEAALGNAVNDNGRVCTSSSGCNSIAALGAAKLSVQGFGVCTSWSNTDPVGQTGYDYCTSMNANGVIYSNPLTVYLAAEGANQFSGFSCVAHVSDALGTASNEPSITDTGVLRANYNVTGWTDHWTSCDGKVTLTQQSDGNLVLTETSSGRLLWASGFVGPSDSYYTIMQSDGNLVTYSSSKVAKWATGTNGNNGARLHVQDDGNLVLWNGGSKVKQSGSSLQEIAPGMQITAGTSADHWTSFDGRFTLKMQTDGNLVLYQGGSALWASNTDGSGATRAIMQHDGNLVVYAGEIAKWTSGTSGHSAATLAIQDDGNLVVYTGPASNSALWASGTGTHENGAWISP